MFRELERLSGLVQIEAPQWNSDNQLVSVSGTELLAKYVPSLRIFKCGFTIDIDRMDQVSLIGNTALCVPLHVNRSYHFGISKPYPSS